MKFTDPQHTTVNVVVNFICTAGLLGITLVILIALGKISVWWALLAAPCVLVSIGNENAKYIDQITKKDLEN
jgi:hypothetical protein